MAGAHRQMITFSATPRPGHANQLRVWLPETMAACFLPLRLRLQNDAWDEGLAPPSLRCRVSLLSPLRPYLVV
jgi:hypothetical protein